METTSEFRSDCYAQGDRGLMEASQRLRARLLGPLLGLLTRLGVRADHLTFVSLIVGLAACPFMADSLPIALGLIGLHVALDGLDGPLARYQGLAGPRGSFTDTLCDQLVVSAVGLTLIHNGTVSLLPGAIYLLAYTVVVGFAMARNALRVPYSWLVRPRFIIYAWVLVDATVLPGTLDYVLWLFGAVLMFKVFTGFLQIRTSLGKR